jgi:nucleoside-diphosphate-sugar epimerase
MTQPHAHGTEPSADRSAGRRRLVVGCGYLGRRVAAAWRAGGDAVWAITRSPQRATVLAAAGLEPLVIDLTGPYPLAPLPAVDTVLWSVSPDPATGTGHHALHVVGMGALLDALPGTPRILFTSSTGVYGEAAGGIVTEATPPRPDRPAGVAILEAEENLAARCPDRSVVLRLAGLYGPGRLPRLDDLRAGRPLAGDPDTWLNLIHADDAAAVVTAVADHPAPGPLYVVSDGQPVRRREWYAALARLVGAPSPSWDTTTQRPRGGDKRVDPAKLFREIAPVLRFPDPYQALDKQPAAPQG